MVLDLIAGFVLLVAASYIGTTMALRGFFDDAVIHDAASGGDSVRESSESD